MISIFQTRNFSKQR